MCLEHRLTQHWSLGSWTQVRSLLSLISDRCQEAGWPGLGLRGEQVVPDVCSRRVRFEYLAISHGVRKERDWYGQRGERESHTCHSWSANWVLSIRNTVSPFIHQNSPTEPEADLWSYRMLEFLMPLSSAPCSFPDLTPMLISQTAMTCGGKKSSAWIFPRASHLHLTQLRSKAPQIPGPNQKLWTFTQARFSSNTSSARGSLSLQCYPTWVCKPKTRDLFFICYDLAPILRI